MTLLVDDQVLSLLLRGEELPGPFAVEAGPVYTTDYWYVRMEHALAAVQRIAVVLTDR